ncbi:Na(+)-translocating NADH-quinone reductase subunit A [Endozoicomonas sp. SM1973]|uniref:Na(+)-translocating NADH-quinone reductase subunit A n=1 Tax=Spartinivicinus marinus TaxID=2994442 RepID=A0A853I2M6_9GAMM|nr:Na(+)-translocating NADH-quinone reductase subunit A [Spartinivicinus marinus]MCX4029404.1 Na(+)-translocating NADH-quinone reductase subunit A [Spartinivicinus marinus]NYZ64978.1 Na(+)-translocating NADH-quinone reductase subunit A [Spartinivicinus marinus]
MINIKRGLDLPITGSPEQVIADDARQVKSVAVVGFDYPGMKPTMQVAEGDRVKKGQILFEDKKSPGIFYTAPAAGVVAAINRGEKRVFQSLVIDIEGDEEEAFAQYEAGQLATLSREQVTDNLIKSGQWTAFRSRPFSKVPAVDAIPHSIFVTAIDTHPLAADPAVIITEQAEAFGQGLEVIGRLTEGKVFVCQAPDKQIPTGQAKVVTESFAGPHPAGLPGTHIHHLDPVHAHKSVWHIGYQDVIAIGKLFTTGKLYTDRVVALGGPQAEKPRLVRAQVGASLEALCAGEQKKGENRLISGSVFGGRSGKGPFAYLGRYHVQVSILLEGSEREFIGWLSPGKDKHSVLGIYLSKLSPSRLFNFTTTTNGSARAMVPVGNYEKVMPLDILPTQLLRALIVGDTVVAQQLGCLELDEEDLALCSYVCAGKYEYGPILRDNLTRIEVEG